MMCNYFAKPRPCPAKSIFSQELITIADGMALKKCNDVVSGNAVSNDVTRDGTPATNDWLYSHGDKC